MWPPIYQGFESHSCLYTEFTGAGEEKCMPNSCSVNTVQSKQGTGPTSLRSRCAYMYLQIASNPLQDIATGLYRTDLFLYSQKEFLAISFFFFYNFVCTGRVPDPTSLFPPDLILYVNLVA